MQCLYGWILDYIHKLLPLQIGMKNVLMKYLSVLMTVWYCLSIIGFDIHSCVRTGERYVTSAIGGVECIDIHPEHSCHAHHHEGEEVEDPDCCTNDIIVLFAETLVSSDNHRHASDCGADCCSCVPCLISDASPRHYAHSFTFDLSLPDSGWHMPDRQSFLNIWRI